MLFSSGFWNLPFNKDDDWKKREQLSEIERNRLRMEFKKCTQGDFQFMCVCFLFNFNTL